MTYYFGRYGYNNCGNCGGIQTKRLSPSPENPLAVLRKRILEHLKNGERSQAISLLFYAPVDAERCRTFYKNHFST